MAKIGKRQTIILAVMVIAILYFAFDYLSPKRKIPGVDRTQKAAELNTFVSDLSASVGKNTTNNLDLLVFSRAEKVWTRDPFLDMKAYKAWSQIKTTTQVKEAVATPKVEFVYSGYLEVGQKRMAVINGMEYQEGDSLDVKGYALKSITPSNVAIENRGTRTTENVPLLE
jgi:hypothetical protein